ncbi:hypothetical protein GCM10027174_44600 [Salinifilum aidingensis]
MSDDAHARYTDEISGIPDALADAEFHSDSGPTVDDCLVMLSTWWAALERLGDAVDGDTTTALQELYQQEVGTWMRYRDRLASRALAALATVSHDGPKHGKCSITNGLRPIGHHGYVPIGRTDVVW